MYKDIAVAEMKRTGIPASITLAQGLLETESGNSDLVKRSNNHFGIKCKSSWKGESVSHTDDAPNECFRKYSLAEDSYRDHSDYLSTTARYASLFTLNKNDYRGWSHGLKRAGYATNPKYPQILITNIERYNLQKFDQDIIGDTSVFANAKIIDTDNKERVITIAKVVNDERVDEPLKNKTAFNGLKALLANRGTSLLAIATRANIPLSKLLEYNDLEKDGLLEEQQWIFLERKAKEGNRDYYITMQNETLYHIAQNNGVQLQYLMQYNGINENVTVSKGTQIKLKEKTSPLTEPGSTTLIHTVVSKENLYAISKKYNVTVQQIKDANHLTDDALRTGQKLIIPNVNVYAGNPG
jgi:LysM repeat protein